MIKNTIKPYRVDGFLTGDDDIDIRYKIMYKLPKAVKINFQ